MAEQLVSAMTGEFNASQYHDEYREALLKIIEAKAAGQTVEAPAPTPSAGVTDLMAALEASVAAAKAARESSSAATTANEPEPIAAGAKPRRAVAVGPGRSSTDAAKKAGQAARAGRADAADESEREAETIPARRRKAS